MNIFFKNTLWYKIGFLCLSISVFQSDFSMEAKQQYLTQEESLRLATLMGESIKDVASKKLYLEVIANEIQLLCNKHPRKIIEETLLNELINNSLKAFQPKEKPTDLPDQKKYTKPQKMVFPRGNAIAYALSKCETNNENHQSFYKAFVTTGINEVTRKQVTISETALKEIISLGLTALKTIEDEALNKQKDKKDNKKADSAPVKVELYKECARNFANNEKNIRYFMSLYSAYPLNYGDIIMIRYYIRVRIHYEKTDFIDVLELLKIIKEIFSDYAKEMPRSRPHGYKSNSEKPAETKSSFPAFPKPIKFNPFQLVLEVEFNPLNLNKIRRTYHPDKNLNDPSAGQKTSALNLICELVKNSSVRNSLKEINTQKKIHDIKYIFDTLTNTEITNISRADEESIYALFSLLTEINK